MIKVTVCKADGTITATLLQPNQISMIDQDNRDEHARKGANSVVTMLDGRKMWVRETVEELATRMGA